MIRPDAMDRDVASLMGLDAVIFAPAATPIRPARKTARAARAARPARKKAGAKQSPWLWAIAPLAAALVVGVGLSWRSDEEEQPRLSEQPEQPGQTAQRPEAPELRPSQASRAMSLKIIDGPDRKQQRRPQNFPAWQIDPAMANRATAPVETAALADQPAIAPTPSGEPEAELDPMAHFADEELAPTILKVAPPEPRAASEPLSSTDRVEAVDAVRALRQK